MTDALNILTEDWNKISEIVLFGYGQVAIRNLEILIKDFHIPFIIDTDAKKAGASYKGIPVVTYEEGKKRLKGRKIVVSTTQRFFLDIARTLENDNLLRHRDFCSISQFMVEWYLKNRNKYYIYHMDIAVTTKCTFNCEHCNMFIPYHKNGKNYSFEEIKTSMDLLMERIDGIFDLGILGGEPLLNNDLIKMLDYFGDRYGDRIGQMTVITNGSILPSEELLKVMKKYRVYMGISDYSNALPYKDKLDRLDALLEEWGIVHVIKKSLIWCAPGFPVNPRQYTEEAYARHIELCRPDWNGLHDNKFYYCNVAWSAGETGLYNLHENDYIELETLKPGLESDKRKIVEMSRGICSFCKVCGGCGTDNEDYVPVGRQLQRNINDRSNI